MIEQSTIQDVEEKSGIYDDNDDESSYGLSPIEEEDDEYEDDEYSIDSFHPIKESKEATTLIPERVTRSGLAFLDPVPRSPEECLQILMSPIAGSEIDGNNHEAPLSTQDDDDNVLIHSTNGDGAALVPSPVHSPDAPSPVRSPEALPVDATIANRSLVPFQGTAQEPTLPPEKKSAQPVAARRSLRVARRTSSGTQSQDLVTHRSSPRKRGRDDTPKQSTVRRSTRNSAKKRRKTS